MSSPDPYLDLRSKLEAANLGVPISWPNEKFLQPNPPSPFLVVGITSTVTQPHELGGAGWTEEGTATIDVFVPARTGSLLARQIAKAVSNVFRGIPPQPVVYLSGSIGNGVIAEPDGLWWVLTVSVDWQYQDTT